MKPSLIKDLTSGAGRRPFACLMSLAGAPCVVAGIDRGFRVGAGVWLIGTVFLACSVALVWPDFPRGWPSDWRRLFNAATAVLEAHRRTLGARKRVTVSRDPYGVEDDSKWQREMRHVFHNVLVPGLRARMTDRQFGRGVRAGFRALPWSSRSSYRGEHRQIDWFARFALELIDATADEGLTESGVTSQALAHMTPAEFEQHCADLLRTAGWSVTVLGGSGDQGADLLAERDGVRAAFQCKLYSSPIGNSAVQEVNAGRRVHGADRAYVVTNAGYTPGARAAAAATGVVLLDVAELSGLD